MRTVSLAATVLSLFVAACNRSQDPPANPKGATSAEEAVKLLLEAAKADNIDNFLAHVGGHGRALAEWSKADELYRNALADKFGKKPDFEAPTFKESM
jgi:hypothetical protein